MTLHPVTRVAVLFTSMAGMVTGASVLYPVAVARIQRFVVSRMPAPVDGTGRSVDPCPVAHPQDGRSRCLVPADQRTRGSR